MPTDTPSGTFCKWCKTELKSTDNTCPKCGAPRDFALEKTDNNWLELPPVKDMTQIQFGNSTCAIHGEMVPAAELNLHKDDSVYFTHHSILWKESEVIFKTMSLKKGFKRLFAGLPLIMTEAHGPGRIAFSHHSPGELIAIPLDKGEEIDVKEHVFLLASNSIRYDWFNTNLWAVKANGNDQETVYPLGMFMDRFEAKESPGLLLLHSHGNCFMQELQESESILIHPNSLLFKSSNLEMSLHLETPGQSDSVGSIFMGGGLYGNYNIQQTIWIRLKGPGRIAIQSAFPPSETDYSSTIVRCPQSTTTKNWSYN